MQNRSYNGLELEHVKDYNTPNSPCAAQPIELSCPNSCKELAPKSFYMTEEGEAKSVIHCNLLSAHIYPPWQKLDSNGSEGTEGETFHLSWEAAANFISLTCLLYK